RGLHGYVGAAGKRLPGTRTARRTADPGTGGGPFGATGAAGRQGTHRRSPWHPAGGPARWGGGTGWHGPGVRMQPRGPGSARRTSPGRNLGGGDPAGFER